MTSPLPPLALAVAAAAADASGLHRPAFYLVLVAIPFAAGAALAAAAELAEGFPVVARAACTTAALALLVVSSAVRANMAAGAQLPAFAGSALIGCIGAYLVLVVLWLVLAPRALARA